METKNGEVSTKSEQVVGKTSVPDKGQNPATDQIKEGEKKEEASEVVLLTFRENRKYELHLGRHVYLFGPRGSNKVQKKHIERFSKDWDQAKSLFIEAKEKKTEKEEA